MWQKLVLWTGLKKANWVPGRYEAVSDTDTATTDVDTTCILLYYCIVLHLYNILTVYVYTWIIQANHQAGNNAKLWIMDMEMILWNTSE